MANEYSTIKGMYSFNKQQRRKAEANSRTNLYRVTEYGHRNYIR